MQAWLLTLGPTCAPVPHVLRGTAVLPGRGLRAEVGGEGLGPGGKEVLPVFHLRPRGRWVGHPPPLSPWHGTLMGRPDGPGGQSESQEGDLHLAWCGQDVGSGT